MPKLLCPCGHVHDLSPIPDGGWRTIKDSDLERSHALWNEVEELGKVNQQVQSNRIGEYNSLVGLLYECSSCGTLLWQKPGDKEYLSFSPSSKQVDK